MSGAIQQERLVYITNPADRSALELALRWKEQVSGQVYAFTCGSERAAKTLREALSVGADFVTQIDNTNLPPSPLATAHALATEIQKFQPDIVLCGARSVDMASGQVPGYLAELLRLALATAVVEAQLEEDGKVKLERKLERGKRERIEVLLPAVLAVESSIAELRYASFPALLVAQKAKVEIVPQQKEANSSRLKLQEIVPPRPRPRQIFIPNPDMPAAARIAAILSGGAAVKQKKGGALEGSPEEQAERILNFLEQNGFLESEA